MKRPKAELISIGNEILNGYTINTNAAFISRTLREIGVGVNWVTTIADEADEIYSALNYALNRAQIVVVTGGLGPTPDDITKNSICRFFDTELVTSNEVIEDLKKVYKTWGRELPETAKDQALIPDGAQIIQNTRGTAPGIVMEKDNVIFAFTPGVPYEMQAMIATGFTKLIKQRFRLPEIHTHLLRTTGIAESNIHHILKDLIAAHQQFPFAFLPRQIGVDLRFRYDGNDVKEIKQWAGFIDRVRNLIKDFIFTEDERDLGDILIELLTERKLTISSAESFTGGLLGDWLTNVPGASQVYSGGIIAYSNAAKVTMLDIKPQTLKEHGAVSSQTAIEMARGAQKHFATHCSIATTGIAGPSGATKEKPVGRSYVAARFNEKEIVREFTFGKERKINKMRGAMAGMELLRRLLLGI